MRTFLPEQSYQQLSQYFSHFYFLNYSIYIPKKIILVIYRRYNSGIISKSAFSKVLIYSSRITTLYKNEN